ncbi:Ku protein [Saccharopolyspora shandongensis]|uniref:Ku protein n=1 Tax=Saccharopolyspora shandongensis TaxID=418495 RepID=UPI0033DF634D
MLSEEDPAELPLPSSHMIEVAEFLPVGAVDPVLFDGSYVLQPQQVGLRTYCLLRAPGKTTGRVGLGRITIRTLL